MRSNPPHSTRGNRTRPFSALLALYCALVLPTCALEPSDLDSDAPDASVRKIASALQPAPDPTLLGYWNFDETSGTTALDASGHGQTGTIINATRDTNGRSGGALYFNGTNARVSIPDGVWNVATGSPVTYSAWYKADGSPQGQVFEHRFTGAVAGAFGFGPSQFQFSGYDSTATSRGPVYNQASAPYRWTMVTAVVTNAWLKVYKDGVLLGTTSFTGGFPKISGPLYVGARGELPDNFFKGWIDEVSVYGRALDEGQVAALFHSYDPQPPLPWAATGLVGRWKLDEGGGTVAADSSGFNSNGEVLGATWDANGISGSCLHFNGTSSLVRVLDGVWNQVGNVTYIAWYKEEAGSTKHFILDHEFTSGIPGNFAVATIAPAFGAYDATNQNPVKQGTWNWPTAAANEWRMIAAVVTPTDVKLYSNGTYVGRYTISGGGIPYRIGRLFFGGRGSVPDNYFKGWIDEVSIYAKSLTDADVLALYNQTRGIVVPTTCAHDSDCPQSANCAFGVSARFGLPPNTGVCWNTEICTHLDPTNCGSPSSLCGQSCCLPQCGAGSGGADGCGGTCQACVAEADSDADGLSDCAERSDPYKWTHPLVANEACGNGVVDSGEACDAALTPYCTFDCTEESTPIQCDASNPCPQGQMCGLGNGAWFGMSASLNVCVPIEPCANSPSSACGTNESACGPICPCIPNCQGRSCGDEPDDGCGGFCTGWCGPRESGCTRDSDCPVDYYCAVGADNRIGLPSGANACLPIECQDYMTSRMECGSVSDPCGLCPQTDVVQRPDTACDPGCSGSAFCNSDAQCAERVIPLPPPLDEAPNTPTAEVGPVAGAFAVTPAGTAQYTVPIEVPPGRAGVEPRLALRYDSSMGEGYVAHGWSLTGLPAITRCPKTFATNGFAAGVRGEIDDAYCMDGQQLIVVNGYVHGTDGAEYRTELDSFTKVLSLGTALTPTGGLGGPERFQIWTKDGKVLTFGGEPGSRRISNGLTLTWYLNRVEDLAGNRMDVIYEAWEQEFAGAITGIRSDIEENRPVAIYYTSRENEAASRKVILNYDDTSKNMLPRRFMAGAAFRVSSPLRSIETFIDGDLVRTYRLSSRAVWGTWLLDQISLCVPSSSGERCLPPTTFTYDENGDDLGAPQGHQIVQTYDASSATVLDFDGDGDDDLLVRDYGTSAPFHWALHRSLGHVANDGTFLTGPIPPIVKDLQGHSIDVLSSCAHFRPLDFNEDGRTDLYAECAPNGSAANSIGPRYVFLSSDDTDANGGTSPVLTGLLIDDPPYRQTTPAAASALLDLDSDGRLDYVLLYSTQVCEVGNCPVQPPPYSIAWRRNRGPAAQGGQLAPREELGTTSSYEIGDYDGDGQTDLLIRTAAGHGAILAIVNGEIRHRLVAQSPSEAQKFKAPYLGIDANGDGHQDRIYWNLVGYLPVSDPQYGFQQSLYLSLDTGNGYTPTRRRDSVPSLFTGAFAGACFPEFPETCTYGLTTTAMFAFDRDNDGRQELYVAPAPSNAPGPTAWQEYRPIADDGGAWNMPLQSSIAYQGPSYLTASCGQNQSCSFPILDVWYRELQEQSKPIPMDVNGDGTADLVELAAPAPATPFIDVRFSQARTRYQLKEVNSGSFQRIQVGYDVARLGTNTPAYSAGTGCTYPQRCTRRSRRPLVAEQVVTGIASNFVDPAHPSASSVVRHFEYQYIDGRTDLRGRGALGFRTRVVSEVQRGPNDPETGAEMWQTLSRTSYDYDLQTYDDNLRLAWRADGPTDVATLVNTSATETTSATTHLLLNHYERELKTSDSNRPYVTIASIETTKLENGVAVSKVIEAHSDYDSRGNAQHVRTTWGLNGEGPVVDTTVEYETRQDLLANQLTSLPRIVTIRGLISENAAASTSKTIEVSAEYNDHGQPLSISRRGAYGGASVGPRETSVFEYDQYGNPTDVTRTSDVPFAGPDPAPPRSKHIDYDAEGYFPAALSNGLHSALGVLPTKLSYDRRNGQLQYREEPSGDWIALQYDGVGRLQWALDKAGKVTTSSYGLGSRGFGPWEETVWSAGEPRVTAEYNAFGQLMLRRTTRSTSFGVDQESWEEFGYDQRGRLVTRGIPHFSYDPSPGAERYVYDELGRLVEEQAPYQGVNGEGGLSITKHFYKSQAHHPPDSPDSWLDEPGVTQVHVVQDPLNYRTVHGLDMRGNEIALTDAKGGTARYAYGAFDYLERVDFAGTATFMSRNEMGSLVSYGDPERGTRRYTYDGFGDLLEYVRNPNTSSEQVSSALYDGLGRPLEETTQDGTYKWEWDAIDSTGDGEIDVQDIVPSGVGRLIRESLTSSTIGTSANRYFYDGPMGAVSRIDREIDGSTYLTAFHYNDRELLDSVSYPTSSAAPLTVSYSYNNYGQATAVARVDGTTEPLWTLSALDAFGSPTVSQYGNGVTATAEREAQTGRLHRTSAAKQSQTLYEEVFRYDPRGLLAFRGNEDFSAGQVYGHDELGRLVAHLIVPIASPMSYDYDVSGRGNLLSSPIAGTLTYDDPAAPDRVTGTSDGRSFSYDAFGNQNFRLMPDGHAQILTYTSFDLPRKLEEGFDGFVRSTEYQYDASNTRILRKTNTGDRTTYVGDLYREDVALNGSVQRTAVVRLPDDSALEIALSSGNAQYHYIHEDHQGSAVAVSSRGGTREESRAYYPFGATNSSGWTTTVRSGFTGHEHDSYSGLINMKGRMYDPELGRFLSADPIVDVRGSTQGLNPYSYVLNSPLNLIDPSGYEEECQQDGPDCIVVVGKRDPPGEGGTEGAVQDPQNEGTEPYEPEPVADGALGSVDESEGGASEDPNDSDDHGRAESKDGIEPSRPGPTPGLNVVVELARGVSHGVDTSMHDIEVMIGSQIPIVGELMDLDIVLDTQAPTYARMAATISLGVNALFWGLAPNAAEFLPSGACFTAGTVVVTSSGEVPIENLRVGDRVVTASTSVETPTEVDSQTWRLVHLEMPNPDESNDVIELSLLRPLSWIQDVKAEEGTWVNLSLNELGLENRARVRSIEACPVIAHGAGRVVLGTLTHLSGYVRTLAFEGTNATIEPTREHRLYSLDRNDWISAGDLVEGETLQSAGGPIVVASNTASPGIRRVFNIEVEDEHEFLASELEIRSHNSYAGSCSATLPTASIARIVPGSLPATEEAAVVQTLAHIDAGTVPSGALAKKWGTQFKNWSHDLPGPSGVASPYREYRVAPPAGTPGAGMNRVVVNGQTGETYYTWTHYGDSGKPAFVQVR